MEKSILNNVSEALVVYLAMDIIEKGVERAM
jgi:hypothetical protein